MPQESGSVNPTREALVRVRFTHGESFEFLIDTGFDGALMLPAISARRLGLRSVGRLAFDLVGGNRIRADVALAEVKWLGERRNVEVVMNEGSDFLIGTELFEGAKLVIDYANRLVTVSCD